MSSIYGKVIAAGGGEVRVLVDRDTEFYPNNGASVTIEAERERTRHWRDAAAVYKRQRDEAVELLDQLPKLGTASLLEHVRDVVRGAFHAG